MGVDIRALQRSNDLSWKTMLFSRSPNDFDARAKIMFKNKWRYLDIVKRLRALGSNMPDEAWVFIAVIHERESSMNFNTHLGQGDLLMRNGVPVKTIHVPANRGPFADPYAFEKAAVDALWFCAPYAAKVNKDWSISGMLTYLERYNGIGYAARKLPSPYLWAGTNRYTKGKYIADGVFSSEARDTQLGVAGLLKRLDFMDADINFGEMPDAPSIVPSIPNELVPVKGVHDFVWVQWALNELGQTPPLDVDGVAGPNTRVAVRLFQSKHNLPVNGVANATVLAMITRELRLASIPEFPENAHEPELV